MRRVLKDQFFNYPQNLAGFNGPAQPIEHIFGFCIYSKWTVAALTARTFDDADVDVPTSAISYTAHGFITGQVGRLTTTGVLPAPLATATDYYIIAINANTFKLASSYANALAGTFIVITSAAGGGDHTFTPTALSGASTKLQGSVNYDPHFQTGDWFDLVDAAGSPLTVNITATGSKYWNIPDSMYEFVRQVVVQTNGLFAIESYVYAKGM